ncbi:MAG: hypothetical protein E6K14_09420 [Methanobacteriota archaeon]|nr:MAG: hypothetical protein E6K14_09420 [Euryarchaeota archaeon]
MGAPATPTSSGIFPPAAVYNVDRSAPLSETHQGVVGPATSPQAFKRWPSTVAPPTAVFDTSGVTV